MPMNFTSRRLVVYLINTTGILNLTNFLILATAVTPTPVAVGGAAKDCTLNCIHGARCIAGPDPRCVISYG